MDLLDSVLVAALNVIKNGDDVGLLIEVRSDLRVKIALGLKVVYEVAFTLGYQLGIDGVFLIYRNQAFQRLF